MGRRARVAEPAAQAGLGEVRHLHRERRAFLSVLATAERASVLPFVGSFVLATHGHLLAGLVVIALAIGAFVTYRYTAPLIRSRRWVSVCRDGLLLTSDPEEPIALRWSAIRTRPFVRKGGVISYRSPKPITRTVTQVSYLDHSGVPREFEVDMFSRAGPLRRSIETGAPAPMSRTPEILWSLGTIAVVGMIVWLLVLPQYVTHQEDRLPVAMSGLSVACQPPGTAFHAAAAFAGPAPHPVAVYFRDVQLTDLDPTSSVAWQPELPPSVQLIACVTQLAGDAALAGDGPHCTYSTQLGLATRTFPLVETRYRINLYELRTHRAVATFTTVGKDDSCPADLFSGDTIPSRLSAVQYRDLLGPYVGS